jgi:hypothetical protein
MPGGTAKFQDIIRNTLATFGWLYKHINTKTLNKTNKKSLKAWERPGTNWREKPKTSMPGDPLSAAYAPGEVVGESKYM